MLTIAQTTHKPGWIIHSIVQSHLTIPFQNSFNAMLEFCSCVGLQLVYCALVAKGSREEVLDLSNGGRIVHNVQRLGVNTEPAQDGEGSSQSSVFEVLQGFIY